MSTIMLYLSLVFTLVGVLISVAFFTLMERKMMAMMHFRKGPNKTPIKSISLPIADAAKLMVKENHLVKNMFKYLYMMGPIVGFSLMLLTWVTFSFSSGSPSCLDSSVVWLIGMMSLTPYMLLLTSWGSNSSYSIMGGHRAVMQMMSYETCMITVLLIITYLVGSYSMKDMKYTQSGMWFMLMFVPLFALWMATSLAESNRTPFDLAEAESELVSGFNVEYSGGMFALIFLSEYGMMLVSSFLTVVMFSGSTMFSVKILLLSMFFIWSRCCFPRLRGDQLMMVCWKYFLPSTLAVLSWTMIMIS